MAAVSYSILANFSIFWQILGRQGHLKRANITACNPWCYQLWVQVRLAIENIKIMDIKEHVNTATMMAVTIALVPMMP